jgi:hypothetical protein
VADNLRREPIAGIPGASRWLHPTRLPTSVGFRKQASPKLTVPSES